LSNACCRNDSENLNGSKSKERIGPVDNLKPETEGNLPSKHLCVLDTSDAARSKLNSAVKVLIQTANIDVKEYESKSDKGPRSLQVYFRQREKIKKILDIKFNVEILQ
jgi:hypothetical protein